MEKMDKALTERAKRQVDESVKEANRREQSWRKNIETRIYIGMPLADFENLFRDYITKQEENVVYFTEPETGEKSRVTFINGLLSKYERFGRWYGIYGTGDYADMTSTLRGYKKY
jgi:hypothetical protein